MIKREYVGKSEIRSDAYEKVTGTAQYTDDIKVSGMLHAKIKTSPFAHAEIVSIDASKARAMEGVRSVITGKEANYKVGIYMADKFVMAVDKVRYYGEIVAAVAADTPEIAAEAVKLIDVEYKPLPVVNDVRDAVKKDAILVHPDLHTYSHTVGVYFPQKDTNIASHIKVRKGDVEKGFAQADVVLENYYTLPQIFHVPMETHNLIVQWGINDQIKIFSSSQSPFSVRDLFAITFGLSKNNIEVNVPYIGGGFGGKAGIHLEPLVGLLSKHANGRPVKLVLTREEECSTLPCRQGLAAKIKTGVTKDGKIIAEEIEYLWDAGAYADYGVNIGRNGGAINGPGPYEVDNLKVDSKTVYTNHLFGTAYRGFGYPEASFGLERQRDLLARAIGMDPVEFRLKNVLRPGSKTATQEVIGENHGDITKCLAEVVKAIDYGKDYSAEEKKQFETTGKYRGRGIALLQKSPAMPTWSASSSIIKMNEDGSVVMSFGGVDMGQGTYTVFRQIVAEQLNMPIERVKIASHINTNLTPYDWQSVASRMTVLGGNAVLDACSDLKRQLLEAACIPLRAAVHDLAIGDEFIYVKQYPEKRVAYADICIGYRYDNGNAVGGPLIGRGKSIAQGLSNLDPETGEGTPALDWTFGAHGMEIEIDINTGAIKILHLASCLDVGKVMNKVYYEGQVLGGSLQGVGSTFSEFLQYDENGKLLTTNFTDYKIPTMRDIPAKRTIKAIETPQMDGPYGARGCGEHPMVAVTPAVANAIYDAIGVDFYHLPLSADRVYARIMEVKK